MEASREGAPADVTARVDERVGETDPRSGFPTIHVGRAVVSEEIAEALDED